MSNTGVPSSVRPGPPGTRFTEIRSFETIDSTNRLLLDEARTGAPEGLVATAEFQTEGRGRLGRRWEAPRGSNLLFSVLLRPEAPVEDLHLWTAVVAMAAAEACRKRCDVSPTLKWPNDLVVGDRKLAGILAESDPRGHGPTPSSTPRALVVGVGLNVNWPPAAARDHGRVADGEQGEQGEEGEEGEENEMSELLRSATSLFRETGRPVPPQELLGPVLVEADRGLDDLAHHEGRRAVVARYRERCSTLGRDVRVSCADETFSGRATDLTPQGQLVVDVGGIPRVVVAGDVVHLRHG